MPKTWAHNEALVQLLSIAVLGTDCRHRYTKPKRLWFR